MRLPDVYNRIQASTKCVVLGTDADPGRQPGLAGNDIAATIKGLICILFILITSGQWRPCAVACGTPRPGFHLCDQSSVVTTMRKTCRPDDAGMKKRRR